MQEKFVKLKEKVREDKKIYNKEQISAPDFKYDYGRLIKCGYVVFDFDEQPYIDIISNIIKTSNLKCKMLITNRGLHFMFKTTLETVKNKNHEFNWIGLQCDIKGLGTKEETKIAYQAIKVNGETRKEEYINGATTDEELDIAPKWLYHVTTKKEQIDLTKDQTGNRNSMFHGELMIKAKKGGFSYEEYCQMANIINTYVLPNSLSKEELNTAIRFEEWEGIEIFDDKIFLLDMARDVINYFDCKIYNGNLIFFDDSLGHYSNNENTIFCYIQEKYADKNITKGRILEVMAQMDIQLNHYEKYAKERSSEYIVCKDKIVSMYKDETKDITKDIFTDIYYPYSIMTDEELKSYNGIGKKFLNDISCNRPDVEQVICECLGCMLSPTNPFGKIFIWYGTGANGKSVLIKVMKKIMGSLLTNANILNINDRFGLSRAYKGIANVTDDVGITTIRETGVMKSIIDGSSIEVDRKHRDSVDWVPNSQFLMCCNQIPKIKDTTNGMIRRLSFIPFDLHLEEKDIDTNLLEKLFGIFPQLKDDEKNDNALRYIMTKSIVAFRQAKKRGHLTTLDKQKELLNDFKEENKDPYHAFYDYLIEQEEGLDGLCKWIDNKSADEVYSIFKEFIEVEVKGISQRRFSTNFNKLLPSNIITKNYRVSKTLVVKKYYVI